MAKVSVRGGFSDRNAIRPENTEIQMTEFDRRTRIQLENAMYSLFKSLYDDEDFYGCSNIQSFINYVLGIVYSEPIDGFHDIDQALKMIKGTIENDNYDDVLTIIEALGQYWDNYLKEQKGFEYFNKYENRYTSSSVYEFINSIFQKEYVGYRFIDGQISPISDEREISTIEECLNNKYQPIHIHISKANTLLSSRDKPDYENSIKESISAVEAMCEIITGLKGREATLGNMLKYLEHSGIKIHGGLKSAFNILYGYTCDSNGIRHAGDIGGPSSSFEEAKFMLVSCCAFINYLTALCAN